MNHLHNHTIYSVGDSLITPEELSKAGDVVAITDHGTLSGVLRFQKACKKNGTKPIFGMEAYHSYNNKVYHMTLLCQDMTGYRNLMKLNSWAYKVNQIDGLPCINYEILKKHNDGLICLTGDIASSVGLSILFNDKKELMYHIKKLTSIFNDRLYFQSMPNDIREYRYLSDKISELGDILKIKVVETSDSHYMKPDDSYIHAVLKADSMMKLIESMVEHNIDDFYPRFDNDVSKEIADRCNLEIPTGKTYMPDFEIPEGFNDPKEYLRYLSIEGLKDRIGEIPLNYMERLDYELEVITNMGYEGYFLIVSDFVKFAHDNDIMVGPGRGSGAGSIVAWSLGITNLDPIHYGLLFERFLNPDRISLPDIDIDFCYLRRDEIVSYLRRKYGDESVAYIGTFTKLKAKAAWKAAARALGVSMFEQDEFSKVLPVFKALTEEDQKSLAELVDTDVVRDYLDERPHLVNAVDVACRLEGPFRSRSKHAAGIVLSSGCIEDYVPIFTGKEGEIITDFDMKDVEAAGLVKFDLLGLKELSIIDMACKLSNININKIPLDCEDTFKLISSGRTLGIFQIKSRGMQDLMKNLQPSELEDIIAAVALYRPGPMGSGMLDVYAECRHGVREIQYLHPDLEPILKRTYGVLLYQEQVMEIARVIAGFTLGEADSLRRAVGKKIPSEMAKYKDSFISGCVNGGYESELGDKLFELISYFASYGFNKSHSAAYGLITYQTAYLKQHFTAEFLASQIFIRNSDIEEVAAFIHEAKSFGLKVIPPDVNVSPQSTTGKDDTIWLGYETIKGVGKDKHSVISENKPYLNINDFVMRTKCSKRDIDALLEAGALDSIIGASNFDEALHKRSEVYDNIKETLKQSRARSTKTVEDLIRKVVLVKSKPWSRRYALDKEFDRIGYFRSGHPVDPYVYESSALYDCVPVVSWKNESSLFNICGIIKDIRIHTYYKDEEERRMAWVTISDPTGEMEVTCFHKTLLSVETLLRSGAILIMTIKKDYFKGADSAILNEVEPITSHRLMATSAFVINGFSNEKESGVPVYNDEVELVGKVCLNIEDIKEMYNESLRNKHE